MPQKPSMGVLVVQTKAHLVEIFVSPTTYYGLFIIVLRVRDNYSISALFNTARRVILGLNFRRLLKVEELAKKVPLKCPAAIIQPKRLSLWIGLSKQNQGLTNRPLDSYLTDQVDKKWAHMKCWNRQLLSDAKEFFSEDAKGWLANPCSKNPENELHKPNLVDGRPLTTKCSNLNCPRWFAGRADTAKRCNKSFVPKRRDYNRRTPGAESEASTKMSAVLAFLLPLAVVKSNLFPIVNLIRPNTPIPTT
ncbi:hypothetical protein ACTXT7_013468 [Hymenolepis weldensis]